MVRVFTRAAVDSGNLYSCVIQKIFFISQYSHRRFSPYLPDVQFTGIRSGAVPVLPLDNMGIAGDQVLAPGAIRKCFERHAIIRLSIIQDVPVYSF